MVQTALSLTRVPSQPPPSSLIPSLLSLPSTPLLPLSYLSLFTSFLSHFSSYHFSHHFSCHLSPITSLLLHFLLSQSLFFSDNSRYPSRPSGGSTPQTLPSGSSSAPSSSYSTLFGSFGGGSSGFGFGESGSFGVFGRAGSDVVKTDYDQERLLQQLLHSETLLIRIKKGRYSFFFHVFFS